MFYFGWVYLTITIILVLCQEKAQVKHELFSIIHLIDKNIFKFSPNFLKVNFPIKNDGVNDGVKLFKLNNNQNSIINLIKQNKYITQVEISEKLKKSIRTIERNMKKLQGENIDKIY